MPVFEMATDRSSGNGHGHGEHMTSPFGGATLAMAPGRASAPPPVEVSGALTTPFSEALASLGETDLEVEAFAALTAEFEDDEFAEALEALVDEAAARHLTSTGTFSHEAGAMRLAHTEVEQWLETIAAEADRRLAIVEEHLGDRPVDAVTASELDALMGTGLEHAALASPIDAQELFFKKLISKAKKVVKGAAKLVKTGIKTVGKILPTGRIFAALRKLVRPLLERVLAKAIGKLPKSLQPAARKLAGKVGAAAGRAAREDEAADAVSAQDLAHELDEALAEAILAPNDAAVTEAVEFFAAEATAATAADSAVEALDEARHRLARQLVDARPGEAPVAELEQFIPVVMAAMPLVKLGVKIIGRKRVVGFVAGLLANLIKPMIGGELAKPLSRHVADAGLRLLGLEAEGVDDGMLGAEALVAATEDTIRDVMELPTASLEHELLVEAAVEEAFEQAATRHFPPQLLRPDLAQAEDDERGVWVPMPRGTRPHYRYRKYSVVRPVRVTRPMAQAVMFADGDTLEERLLDEGVTSWPVQAEVEAYELLPGGELGHLAAFEFDGESYAEGALAFDEVDDASEGERALHGGARKRRRPARGGPRGRRGPGRGQGRGRRRAGTRVVRITANGRRTKRRRRFALRLDVTGAAPQLRLHLLLSERVAHQMAGKLERNELAQVVSAVRGLLGPARQRAMTGRLGRVLERQRISLPDGGGEKLAAALAEGVERVVAAQLREAAPTLSAAAKDPAAGATLTFSFPFTDRDALTRGEPGEATMEIRAGQHRD